MDSVATQAAPALGRFDRAWVRPARRLGAIVGFLVAWELASLAAQNHLFPTVTASFSALGSLADRGTLLSNAGLTFERAFAGLGIAVVVGVGLGVAMARSRLVEAMFEPLLAAFYPVPRLALYPLFILSVGFGAGSKIALVALECAYPIAYNTFSGVRAIRRQYFWVARNLGAGRLATTGIALRAAAPSLLASLRIAVPIMLVIIVITEMLGTSQGLGYLIVNAGANFEPAQALGVIIFLAICGFLLDRLLVLLTRRLVFWEGGERL